MPLQEGVGVEQTTAKIVDAEKQWVRKGSGNINLEIRYYADRVLHKGTVSVSPSTFREGGGDNEIEVYYMKRKPGRVIPVAVLKGKQRDIHIICAVGSILTVIGVVMGIVKKRISA